MGLLMNVDSHFLPQAAESVECSLGIIFDGKKVFVHDVCPSPGAVHIQKLSVQGFNSNSKRPSSFFSPGISRGFSCKCIKVFLMLSPASYTFL